MRRKDLQREEAFALDTLEKANYAVLSMNGADGAPYAIPLSPVLDRAYKVIYFHCAAAGEKLDYLKKDPRVCLTAVGSMAVVPDEFTLEYTSAVVHGRAAVVTDEGERVRALMLLCQHYDPKGMGGFDKTMGEYFAHTVVVKITPEEIIGKAREEKHVDPLAHHCEEV
jgi:nitroimidazol reductase NimA-like FMN-containing flavoprotein (pyridoxamine 5'-phosphate oxidase superfamily)